ncbi:MAG: ATP-binding protein [Patescibacteria group bacterium]
MVLIPYILSAVIIGNFILTIIVLSRGIKDRINEIFGLMSFSVVLWSTGILGFYFINLPDYLSSHWIIITHSSAILIAVIFFYFSLNFPSQLIKNKYLYYAYTIPFFFILYYLFFTNKIIGEVINSTYEINPGYIFYSFFIVAYFFGGYISLFLQHKKSKEWIPKIQVRYVLAGSILASFPATITDLIFPYLGIFKYTWLGPVFTLVLILSIAMAISRYRLFNIRVIATELLTFAIWIFVLVRLLLADNIQERLINGGLLLILIIFGILLVRSVLKEVRSREEIEKLAKELEKANVRLKELDQAKSEFVTIASHQLRAPLTAIKGYASMILEGTFGQAPEKIKMPLDRIFQSSNRLVTLINDFLNLSRIERGKMEYTFQKFDLKAELVEIVDEFKASLIERRKSLDLSFSAEKEKDQDYTIMADQEKIHQVISNLIDNSIKYTKQGFVKVSLYKDTARDKIMVKIQDSGMGMDKDTLSRIFEKFTRAGDKVFQVHTEGLGLGLFVAKEIMKIHDGNMWAESEGVNKGSIFYIEFPVKFLTPEEKQKIEEEQREREQNIEGFVKKI